MSLDRAICSRARLARDARFDGKFYIAVLSTRIYCRPICPSRTSKEENVRYFPSAAAAAEAGFRPCLRCRPECSPGTPAVLGTSNTVCRALRLIGETGLEDGGVELLADRLGIGSRHLRRLFLRFLGATPSAVARTRRLHFAKKLIDETSLPMTEIAFASGFGCVRRFNAAIRGTYQRTPTAIRALAHQQHKTIETANQYVFRLHFRPPFAWRSMLEFLASRATPGVEAIDQDTYRRSISANGLPGYFEASPGESENSLVVRIEFGDSRGLFFIVERIRAMFDLNADWAAIAPTLRADPFLRPALAAEPGIRVPGCWDAFELATRAIVDDTGIAARIAEIFGEPFHGPPGITHIFPGAQTLSDVDLTSIGVPRAPAETIRALARGIGEGCIRFQLNADPDGLLERLGRIPGMSGSAAQYIVMRALREPDAFPAGDAALMEALGVEDSVELERRAEAWRPWRSYAAMYLWFLNSHR